MLATGHMIIPVTDRNMVVSGGGCFEEVIATTKWWKLACASCSLHTTNASASGGGESSLGQDGF